MIISYSKNFIYLHLEKCGGTSIENAIVPFLNKNDIQVGSLNFEEDKIKNQLHKAMDIFPDRAEPYKRLGKYYNDKSKTELGYKYLKEAKNKNIDDIFKKYVLFVNKYSYGKYVNDELSVACYWTNRGEEGYQLLNEIIDDPEFENNKERLLKNKEHFLNKYPILSQV